VERTLKIDFDQLVIDYRGQLENTHSDMEALGLFAKFLSELHDGHVSISFYDYPGTVQSYSIPVFVAPFFDPETGEFKPIIEDVNKAELPSTRIAVGDELIDVDGKAVWDYLPLISQYRNVGHSETDRHNIYTIFSRRGYMFDLVPKSETVTMTLKTPDGEIYHESLIWKVKKLARPNFPEGTASRLRDFSTDFGAEMNADMSDFSFLKFGQVTPFYLNSTTQSKFDLQRVHANAEMLKKYGIDDPSKAPDIYAALYSYEGKRILIVRNPTYSVVDGKDMFMHMSHYRALLDQYDQIADVVVVDQTHNGGGSYCTEFAQLFFKGEGYGPVQANNADRLWIRNLNAWIKQETDAATTEGRQPDAESIRSLELISKKTEEAIDAGLPLTEPIALWGKNILPPDQRYHWTKPVLVLADELDGSCADLMPMLIKANRTAKIFGRRTMGLGGNVEKMPALDISGATFRVTRGLFTSFNPTGSYPDESMIENHGVQPDYEHIITVDDFRHDLVDYVEAFSAKAVEQVGN
jgi:hypothetical protein